MKTIKFNGVITSISSRADRSLRLSVVTPELADEERAMFMTYQNINSDFLVEPLDDVADEQIMHVESVLDGKKPSQRLRAVLFVLWKQKGEKGSFEEFYKLAMEAAINKVKDQLEGEDYDY